jgi:hypothetical protein
MKKRSSQITKEIATKFDERPNAYFLGLEVSQNQEKIFLNQGKYAVEILERFDMLECKYMNTPMETKLKLLVR